MLAPRIAVVDLSHYNVIPASLKEARTAGVIGVIHKATEGVTGPEDVSLRGRVFLAKEASLMFGVYHFLRPGDMVRQADRFVAVAKPFDDGNILYAADHEDSGVSLNQLWQFMTCVEAQTGRSCVLYSGNLLKEQLAGKADERFIGKRLWMAQYGPRAVLPPGWSKYWLWQYSDGSVGPLPHSVPGIKSPVDCNDYQGTDSQLRDEWAGYPRDAQPNPVPVPTPVPPGAGMSFGDATIAMMAGDKVCRSGWNGKGMWVAVQVPDANSKMTLPYIYMRTVQGDLVPWLASQTDMLAGDWMIVI